MKNIIFLFSLPRSGSTLLQRILMAHNKIHSISEPWLLLPLFHTLRQKECSADYDAPTCDIAMRDFIAELPNKQDDYFEAIKSFTESLYNKITNDRNVYFLDKTPRYYFIIPEIAKTFPNAKFIFLFRNPLSVMSSIVETWHQGKISLGSNHDDLYLGPKLLANGYELLKKKSIKVNFELLVNNPEKEIEKIFEYLEINFEKNIVENFQNSQLSGKMGDPHRNKYKKIQINSITNWKKTLNTKYRKKYAKKYLNYLGDDLINMLGYNKNRLLKELFKIKNDYKKSFFDKLDLIKTYTIISKLLKIKSNIKYKIIQKTPHSIKNIIKKYCKK